ncbi:hypothetical protein PBCVCvsA1_556R [Paramecium bursaria Chlorella virus CvsA1]|nr:hypothetical protein PBCVCviKI_539R [Paramecium bursaria Chlorella virus CviKI]AGE52618.1 hypothetical protein PBCVCvsA1_556R [Paramecium bursaria Chlorella virus CvsA1]AGE55412.1 hypothetical protein PBCVMA1E_647R [Paramecium bursaria Chlorella virus MA1E]
MTCNGSTSQQFRHYKKNNYTSILIMLVEPHRMPTIEPFKIKNPIPGIVDKGKDIGGGIADKGKDIGGGIADKGKDIGGGIVDKGKDIGGKIGDVGKNVGKGVVNIGKKVGGAFVAFGKGFWKIFGGIFKYIWSILKMVFGNWKILLCVAITCCICSVLSPVLTPMMAIFR